ncbi:MAG: helix-turn-helix domain-containing protein [Acidimicrobiia bacterium]|nr:helix-turn-helix domain-containing protein [Acidimicrobiia bacterium]
MTHSIGPTLKNLRTQRGLTVTEVASNAGIAQPNLSRLEAGLVDPRWSTVAKVMGALDVSPADLEAPADDHSDDGLSLLFDLFTASQRMAHLLETSMADSVITAREYAIYSVLMLGTTTPSALAERLGLPVTTLLDNVRVPVERGHVSRVPNPADGRSYKLHLTKAGRRAHHSASELFQPALDAVESSMAQSPATMQRALQDLGRAIGDAINAWATIAVS